MEYIKFFFFITFIVSASVFDVKHRILPNWLMLAGLLTAFFFAVWLSILDMSLSPLINSLFGFAAGLMPVFIIIILSKGGMGAGDMKFLAVIGAFLYSERVIMALILAIIIAGLYSSVMLVLKRLTRKSEIPFAPFIAIGAILSILLYKHFMIILTSPWNELFTK